MKSVSAEASEPNSIAHHLHDGEASTVKKNPAWGLWRSMDPSPSIIPLSSSSHGHTSSHSASATKIHPQSHSILRTSARESFSRFILSGQRFTAEHTASPASAGGGLLFRGIIRSHLIFISCWEIRDDKLFWWANNAPRWPVLFGSHAGMWVHINKAHMVGHVPGGWRGSPE